MAIWQYTFHILTKKSFESVHKTPKYSSDEFDDEQYWVCDPVERAFFYEMESILNKGESWSSEIDLYGNQESNCFEVLYDRNTNRVKSVSFRIDFTTNYEYILRQIIEFCLIEGLIILDEKLNTIPLNYEAVKDIIDRSPQLRSYNKLRNGNTW